MITFESTDHTFITLGDRTIIVHSTLENAFVVSAADALASSEFLFRRLAQIIVENSFEVPAFACLERDTEELHIFLMGSITAQISGATKTELHGAGASTWTEHAVPLDTRVTIKWAEPPRDATVSRTASADVPVGTLEGVGTQAPNRESIASSSPPVVDQTVSEVTPALSKQISQSPESASLYAGQRLPVIPTAPSSPLQDRAASMPDPNLLGTDHDEMHTPPPDEPREAPHNTDAPEGNPKDLYSVPRTPEPDATLDADEVRRSMTEESLPVSVSNNPLVTARICPCGTPNPLGVNECNSCGSSLRREGTEIKQVPRPSLGSVLLDDGTRIPLENSFVIGRNPPDNYAIDDRSIPGVSIESPTKQVSKVHLEIRLVDWTVNVVDLDSANGTYLEDTDERAPKRLRPHVAEQITPGNTVHLGDRSFVLEAPTGLRP